jgi:hypothetical protein
MARGKAPRNGIIKRLRAHLLKTREYNEATVPRLSKMDVLLGKGENEMAFEVGFTAYI